MLFDSQEGVMPNVVIRSSVSIACLLFAASLDLTGPTRAAENSSVKMQFVHYDSLPANPKVSVEEEYGA